MRDKDKGQFEKERFRLGKAPASFHGQDKSFVGTTDN